jgi:hypothetical protein
LVYVGVPLSGGYSATPPLKGETKNDYAAHLELARQM